MLSASISNYNEIADWISSIRNKEVKIVKVTERPVELRLGFLHPELGVLPLEGEGGEPLAEISRYYAEAKALHPGFRGRNRDRRSGHSRGRRK